MKYCKLMVLAATVMSPAMVWAGGRITSPVPTLGDVGLIALGVGLVATGIAYLRKR